MKIGIYSLSARDKTPEELIELAKKYHCHGIEWWCKEKGHIDLLDIEASASAVGALMRESGLEVAGIAPYFKYNETAQEIEKIFQAAVTLGAKRVRCHSYAFPSDNPVVTLMERQRRWLGETVLPLIEKYDLQLNIEQHHRNICCTPNACMDMVRGFPSERIGIIYDPGNSLFEGFTGTDYALDVMGAYINHVHVKSAYPVEEGGSVPAGRRYSMQFGALSRGDLNWEDVILRLHKLGYKGYFSLEALDKRATLEKLKDDIPFLQEILNRNNLL